MLSSDYDKYLKYKRKYLNLKRQNFDKDNYHYYFIHSTTNVDNLINILETGIIYPGKYLKPKQRKLGNEETEFDYIFLNIYFEDLKNMSQTWNYSLLLHPSIMCDNGFIFNNRWMAGPTNDSIIVPKKTNSNEYIKKLESIRDFIKHPGGLIEFPGTLQHEVLIDHPIYLNENNLLGIVCGACDKSDELSIIRKIIKNKSYKNIKIIKNNTKVPQFNLSIDCPD